MSLQLTGVDVVLVRDSATGKFDLFLSRTGANKGNPELTSSRQHAVLTALLSRKRGLRPGSVVKQGGYYFDPQNRRGSLIWTIAQDRMTTTSQLKAYADDALQQLVERNIIATFTATATRLAPGKFRLDVVWQDLAGKATVQV
jgi:phage gp46-like protein